MIVAHEFLVEGRHELGKGDRPMGPNPFDHTMQTGGELFPTRPAFQLVATFPRPVPVVGKAYEVKGSRFGLAVGAT